jgi:hypothetical protein
MSEETKLEHLRTKFVLNALDSSKGFVMRNSGSFLIEEVFQTIEGFLLSLLDKKAFGDEINKTLVDHPAAFHTDNMIQKIFTITGSFSLSEEFKTAVSELFSIMFDLTVTLHNDLIRTRGRKVSKYFADQTRLFNSFLARGLDPITPEGDGGDEVITVKTVKTSRGTKTRIENTYPTRANSYLGIIPVSQSKLYDRLVQRAQGLKGLSYKRRKRVTSFVDAAGFPICRSEIINED